MTARCFFPALCAALLLGAGTASAQETPLQSPPPHIRARMDSLRAKNYPPATREGLSESELAEYERLLAQHKPRPDALLPEYAARITPETERLLLGLFSRMNLQQQLAQRIVFIRPQQPAPRQSLSDSVFGSFRNASLYLVRIDGREATPETLAQYKAADFATYRVDTRLSRSSEAKPYTQRVYLETNRNYEAAERRYARYKNGYLMVEQSTRIEGRSVPQA